MVVQLFAVTAGGPRPLPVPPGVVNAHQVFDGLPLGVYSALRTYRHASFLRLEAHFDRTDRSLAGMGSEERLDRTSLRRAVQQCAEAYPEPESFVRFDRLTAPPRALGTEERTLLALSPLKPVPAAFLDAGVTVRFSPLRRERPAIKFASFVVTRRPYPLGSQEAYEHLILDDSGHILEGSSSNFLAVRGRRLCMVREGALPGITQDILADLGRSLGLECVHAPVERSELPELDEAFLSGSTRGIVPVVSVEGTRIGAGVPGPWTKRLMAAFHEHAQREARPAWEAAESGAS